MVRDTAVPAVTDVLHITAERNRVIRNLRITQTYATLSDAFRARTGDVANWCTFATWASRQAGSTIRGEDMLDRLQRRLGRRSWLLAPIQSLSRLLLRKGLLAPDTTLGRVIASIHTPYDAFERASAAVAEGNLKVFEEIGHEFARFLATVPASAAVSSPEFTAFAAGLRPGPPPDGQDFLREAFTLYQEQRHQSDPRTRAASILLANLQIGLHEQTRLQPQIAAAVDAPLATAADLGRRALHVLVPSARRWPGLIQRSLFPVVGAVARRIRRDAVNVTREVVTESMMVLALPNGVLALGRHLAAPVPESLSNATYAPLIAFLEAHDPCTAKAADCGANDWCDLPQRMHYIVHLFRAYAEDPSLFSPPFSPEQVRCFESGVVPEGTL